MTATEKPTPPGQSLPRRVVLEGNDIETALSGLGLLQLRHALGTYLRIQAQLTPAGAPRVTPRVTRRDRRAPGLTVLEGGRT